MVVQFRGYVRKGGMKNLENNGKFLAGILIIIVCGFCMCVTGYAGTDTRKIVQPAREAEKPVLQPEINFEAVHHHFGKVVQGSTVKHSFAFRNVGNDVLKVEKVGAG